MKIEILKVMNLASCFLMTTLKYIIAYQIFNVHNLLQSISKKTDFKEFWNLFYSLDRNYNISSIIEGETICNVRKT